MKSVFSLALAIGISFGPPLGLSAQEKDGDTPSLAGSWRGTIAAGGQQIPVVFEFSREERGG